MKNAGNGKVSGTQIELCSRPEGFTHYKAIKGKWLGLAAAVVATLLLLCGCNKTSSELSYEGYSTGEAVSTEDKAAFFGQVALFEKGEYSLARGDRTELSLELGQDGLTLGDLQVLSSDENVLCLSNLSLSGSRLSFLCNGLNEGVASVRVELSTGRVLSESAVFTVKSPAVPPTQQNTEAESVVQVTSDNELPTVTQTAESTTASEASSTELFVPESSETQPITVQPTSTTQSQVSTIAREQPVRTNQSPVVTTTKQQPVSTTKASVVTATMQQSISTTKTPVVTAAMQQPVSTTENQVGDCVYVAPTGIRYHISQTCCGKNARAVTLDEAVSMGHTPCKRCAGG